MRPTKRIKGASAILQVDNYEQQVQVQSGIWHSWDILRLSAQHDLAHYGYVQKLGGEEIACDWALDEVVRTLVEQQPWQSPAKDAAVFAGPLGFAAVNRVVLSRRQRPRPLPLAAFRSMGGVLANDMGTMQQQQERRRSVSWADASTGDKDVANVRARGTTACPSYATNAAAGQAAFARNVQSTAASAAMQRWRARRPIMSTTGEPDWTRATGAQQVTTA